MAKAVIITGMDKLIVKVKAMEHAQLTEGTRVFTVIGERIRTNILGHFKAQQNADGSPWAPLAASTIRRRQRRGAKKELGRSRREFKQRGLNANQKDDVFGLFSTFKGSMKADALRFAQSQSLEILADSGRLRGSIAKKVSSSEVIVGTNVIYAPPQQFGSEKNNIPARQFVYITSAEKTPLIQFLKEELLIKPGSGSRI
jgi:phage gpG-like protein